MKISKQRSERIEKLRHMIDELILPLVTSDYVLWGLPYYINPGDNLIWEGTLDLLKQSGRKCLGTCGWDEYKYVPLKEDTVILILGGGYFGDLWRGGWQPVVDTITRYPHNPIVIMPQSIFYENHRLADEDARRMEICEHLTVCVRDKQSYDYALKQFPTHQTILVPDMAFHISMRKLKRIGFHETDKTLYLKRGDKEMSDKTVNIDNNHLEVNDWPLMNRTAPFLVRQAYRICHFFEPKKRRIEVMHRLFMYYGHRNLVTIDAVRFIGRYRTVYSTRLHAMILAYLLGKEIYIVDNSYRKVSGCYEAWLAGSEGVYIYK